MNEINEIDWLYEILKKEQTRKRILVWTQTAFECAMISADWWVLTTDPHDLEDRYWGNGGPTILLGRKQDITGIVLDADVVIFPSEWSKPNRMQALARTIRVGLDHDVLVYQYPNLEPMPYLIKKDE